MKKRKSEISYVNILFCLGVILIHVLSEPVNRLIRTTPAFIAVFIPWRMLTCAVPGFILLSGLKLSLKPVTDWKQFYLRRFTSVIVPYLIWVPIYYFFSYKLGYYEHIGIKHFFSVLIGGTSTAHFYFVVVIVQFYLLYPLWQRLSRINPIIPVALAAVITYYTQVWLPIYWDNNAIVPFYTNDRIFTNYLIYWVLGIYIGRNYDKFMNVLVKFRYVVYAFFVWLAVVDLFFAYKVFAYTQIYLWLYYVNMAYCVFAVLAVTAFCARFSQKHSPTPFIVCLDKSSYYIYLSHLLMLMIGKYALDMINLSGPLKRMPILAVITYVIPVALCMLYTKSKQVPKKHRHSGSARIN